MNRKSNFQHPNLYKKDFVGPILDLEKGEFVSPSASIVHSAGEVTFDFEDYFRRLKDFHAVRQSLKIPEFSYVAAIFCSRTYPPQEIINLVLWCRELYETRWWINSISASMLICIADPDLTENAGWDFYVKSKGIDTYKSLHMPSWFEFCNNGVEIPADWKLDITHGNLVKCTSPDNKYGMVLGGMPHGN